MDEQMSYEGLKKELAARIATKVAQIEEFRRQIREAEAYIQGLQEALALLTGDLGPGESLGRFQTSVGKVPPTDRPDLG